MKIKCSHCSEMTDITIDRLVFENEDEELFVTYLNLEMTGEVCHSTQGCVCEKKNKKRRKRQ